MKLRAKTGMLFGLFDKGVEQSDMETLSAEQVDVLLSRLEREEPPEPVMGAMCYSVAMPPEVAEYICPLCGEKTIYTNNVTEFISWALEDCRRLFDEVAGQTDMNLFLDESRYCSHCTPDTTEDPGLFLTVTRDDGSVISTRINKHDLLILNGFLKGTLYYETFTDGREPLKPFAGRLREILGLPGEEDEE